MSAEQWYAQTARERFDALSERKDPEACWPWKGSIAGGGYGMFWFEGRMVLAHRWAFLQGREIPEGTELDHLCRNRACVNPGHLEPVTHMENIDRGRRKRRVQNRCGKCGREVEGENAIWALHNTARGKKRYAQCRDCRNRLRRKQCQVSI